MKVRLLATLPLLAGSALFFLPACAQRDRLPPPTVEPTVDTSGTVSDRAPNPRATKPAAKRQSNRRSDWPAPAPIEVKPSTPGETPLQRTKPDEPLWTP
jgi:hypothetical protein